MGKHGAALLRRVDPATSSAAAAAAGSPRRCAPVSTQKQSRATSGRRPVVKMSQTPTKGSRYPASWSLWTPNNGIMFGGTSASASATPSAAPRQQPPLPNVVYPLLPLAAYSAPAVPFVSKRTFHAAAQKADDAPAPIEQLVEETVAFKDLKEEEAEKKAEEKTEEKEESKEILPPETTLDFKIPADVFRAARDAAEGTPESYFSYAMYRRQATDSNNKENNNKENNNKAKGSSASAPATVKVHYCKSKHTTDRVCTEHFKGEPLLGFDLEWMPTATKFQGARQNVCLMQIASPSRIGLFHLSLYPKGKDGDADSDLVGPALRSILEDPTSLKTGVAIKGDATRVEKYLGVKMRGVFELSHLHKLVVHSKTGEMHLVNKKLVSLANQTREHLGLPMFKGQDIRSSDWSRAIAMDQIIYSASDAYAAVQIFSVLDKQRKNLKPTPPLPACIEQNLPIKLAGGVVAAAAATEESGEAEDIVEDNAGTTPVRKMTPEYIAQATKTVEFEAEADTDASGATPAKPTTPKARTPTPRSPRTPKIPKTPAAPKDPRITAAEEWLARYRTTASAAGRTVRARAASLRAYHLWHGDATLNPAALAALLRDPPLQTNTVISYVLEAVQFEALPYAKPRMRTELLDQIPADLRKCSKYS